MKKGIIILLALLAISCSKTEKKADNASVSVLVEENLPVVETLKLEKMDISEDYLMKSSCFVYQDSILVVLKGDTPYPLTHMLTLVNLNTSDRIGEYFTRGKGPDEILSALGYLGGNKLDIRCYVSNKFILFNIDSAIANPTCYKPTIVNPEEGIIYDCRSINDTTMLATNVFYFGIDGEFKTSNLPEFFTIDKYGKFNPEYKSSDYENIKCLPANVAGCEIEIDTNKDRIVCCYHFQPYIKVFDINMNLINEFVGPEVDDGKYKLDEDDGFTLFFDGGVNHYYFQSFSDDDNIFVINKRTHNWIKEFNGDFYTRKEKETTEIFRLDWDGNVIGRYSAKGYEILNVSYGQATNTLYLWLIDRDGERGMYKAKLN